MREGGREEDKMVKRCRLTWGKKEGGAQKQGVDGRNLGEVNQKGDKGRTRGRKEETKRLMMEKISCRGEWAK